MFAIEQIGVIILLSGFILELFIAIILYPKGDLIKDMLANLVIGVGVLIAGLLMKFVALSIYSFTYHFSFLTPKVSIKLWLIGFLLCDFINYVYHYLGHKTRILWAAHVTHHSSVHYNLSVGFRINFIHSFYRFLFWIPLCFIGIPPQMILFFETLSAIFGYIIHTEKIKKLGVIDLVFNTPSNHRVHHGSNPEYIDKNMGGILMIFDHLFGTYQREKSTPLYGITNNIDTHNPLKILLHEYVTIYKKTSQIKGINNKIKFLFSNPTDLGVENKL